MSNPCFSDKLGGVNTTGQRSERVMLKAPLLLLDGFVCTMQNNMCGLYCTQCKQIPLEVRRLPFIFCNVHDT